MAIRHQFIFNDKTVGVTTILFKNINPLQNVEKIVFFKETGLEGNWLKKEFRYSFDDAIWSKWNTFTQTNVTKIKFNNQPNFYIEILYTRKNYNTAKIDDLYLFYDSYISAPLDPSTALVDADTLQGNPGSFYLDRSNFVGPYSGLTVENVQDGSTHGVYFGRDDSSLGTTLYFKRIKGGDNVTLSEDSDGIITIDSSGGTGGTVTYQNSNPTIEKIGGIPDNSTYFTTEKTFAQVMQDMFYPVQYPELISPELSSFSKNKPNILEIGDNINIEFNAVFSRGSINPQYSPTLSQYRSGNPNTYNYTGTGLPASVSETSSSNKQNVNGYIVQLGIQTWTCDVSYSGGVQPYDSEGNSYDSPLPPGKSNTKSVSFEGVYPLFATTNTINNPNTEQPLESMISGNNIEIELVAEHSGFKQSFDIPNVWLSSRPLQGIETYNTFTGAWEYEGGSAVNSKTFWNISSTTHNTINYTRYKYNNDDRSSIKIRLKF